jgi:hypothetical protein
MEDKKNDGFNEISDIDNPLANPIMTVAKPETPVKPVKSKTKGESSLNDKMKNVFGNDILFEDHVPKNITVEGGLSEKKSAMKEETKPGLQIKEFKNSSPEKVESPNSKDKPKPKTMEEIKPVSVPKPTAENTSACLIGRTDEFDAERIECSFIDPAASIAGFLLLGQYMVSVKFIR